MRDRGLAGTAVHETAETAACESRVGHESPSAHLKVGRFTGK